MDREEALRLLRGGPDGIAEWNERRGSHGEESPDLSHATLGSVELVGANLQGTRLRSANLRGAKLRDSDLRNADLYGAHLSFADLSHTNLSHANLEQADLHGANLDSAHLDGTRLRSADLTHAYLGGVRLHDADLSDAELEGADFAAASLGGVTINTPLNAAKNLDSVEHTSPSHMALGAFRGAREGIPEVFLRGCGLTNFEIETLRPLLGQAIEFYSCFISYSHADKLFARRLHDALQGKGIRCWLDEKQLLPGDNIHDEVNRGIRLWDKVLLCCSESSLKKSWWVETELETAFAKEQRLQKERGSKALALIPLNLDNYLFEWEDGKADAVKVRVAADFTDWDKEAEKFETALEATVRALRADEGRKETPPVPKL